MHHLSTEQLHIISQLVYRCGQEAQHRSAQHFQVYEKGHQDYVTDVDRALDQRLNAGLAGLFPEDAIISEENPGSWQAFTAGANRIWFIDPLDGTDDFIQGKQHYAIMVGLLSAFQPILGWVGAPVFGQLYYGGIGLGLFRVEDNAEPVPFQPVEPAPPSAEFCPLILGYKDQRRFGAAITRLIPAAQFDSIGSFGLKVIQVIAGKAGLYVYLNRRVKLWDTTGPLALAQAAGLTCCDLQGEPLQFTSDCVNTSTLAHQQAIVVGWQSYVDALLPSIRQAVLDCQAA